MGIFGGNAQDQVDFDALKDRVAKLEAAVASLQVQLASPQPPGSAAAAPMPGTEWMSEVQALVASGNKIQAIKVYRERTGVGLKEAKDAVEALH
jgi:large subunit ribosomal protein L7/L12